MGNNPSRFKGDNLPVERVSWYDAVEFCNRLSRKEGLTPEYTISGKDVTWNRSADGYRLPTEVEWEYAARGGNKSRGYRFSGSDDPKEVAWYSANSGEKTHPVGQKKPNELGIYDMSGNVWEWVWDWYDSDHYSSSPASDPTGPYTGSLRVLRGGSWRSDARDLRSANRSSGGPSVSLINLGFRIVRTK